MEDSRKLATVRRIADLQPIPGADLIEVATIDGWKVVVKKGEFKVGDTAVYFEIDSFLPVRPEFEFLRKACFRSHPSLGEGFRLKTVKLRGQISQGLAIPYQTFPEVVHLYHQTRLYVPDAGHFDVTELLNIRKYEDSRLSMGGGTKGNFPSFLRKTDQERAQNLTGKIFGEWAAVDYEVSLKMDGSSITVYRYTRPEESEEVGVCSRNLELKMDDEHKDNTFVRVATETGLVKALHDYGKNIAVQGELVGPGVQKNIENFPQWEIFIYDVYDIDHGRYLPSHERLDVVSILKTLGARIYHVPVVANHYNLAREGITDIDKLQVLTHRPGVNVPKAEGLVFKSMDGSVSWKIINNEYLLKNDD
jgi:RNA ligase (TIGR02306 family)